MWKNLQRLLGLPKNLTRAVQPNNVAVGATMNSMVLGERQGSLCLQNRFSHTIVNSAGPSSTFLLQPWRRQNETGDVSIAGTNPSQVTQYTPARGMKIKGRVRRRCKDCQLVWEDGILYNFCKTHPRHKQKLKPQYWENLRILTHKTAGTKRPW